MSLWVLDTDALTLWWRGHRGLATRVAHTQPSQLATTIITVEEILRGWYTQVRRAHDDDQLARAYQALQETVEFTRRIQIWRSPARRLPGIVPCAWRIVAPGSTICALRPSCSNRRVSS